jgi:high frequency lysogenization protein
MSPIHERVLALAGVYQAAAEVRRLGRDGNAGTGALNATVHSLFVFDADSVAEVYGGLHAVHSGLTALRNFFTQQRDRASLEITGYAHALIRLERKVSAAPGAFDGIHHELEAISADGLHRPPFDTALLARLANIYVSHVSPTGPRIMIQGEPAYLNAAGNPERIRALLLGGLRSVVLWRQLGGSRLGLVFSRRNQANAVVELLERSTRRAADEA